MYDYVEGNDINTNLYDFYKNDLCERCAHRDICKYKDRINVLCDCIKNIYKLDKVKKELRDEKIIDINTTVMCKKFKEEEK